MAGVVRLESGKAFGGGAESPVPPPRCDFETDASSNRRRKRVRVLVADSPDSIGDVIASMFPGDGEELRLVSSGREALAALANDAFDVVIVCATLADMDFIDLIWQVKRGAKPAPKIIAASPGGNACCGCAGACAMGQGVDGILLKPFTQAEFLETLNSALAGSDEA